jgi:hypothetical protein
VVAYQNTALKANAEVEDGLIRFLKAQEETRYYKESVEAELKAVQEAIAQYKGGLVDYNRVNVIQRQLVSRQEQLAQAQGDIALGLVKVYKALGGGWQIRCGEGAVDAPTPEPVAGHLHAPLNAAPRPDLVLDKPASGAWFEDQSATFTGGK